MSGSSIIIYESIYNDNTLKLARAMAQTLGCMLVTTDRALKMNLDIQASITKQLRNVLLEKNKKIIGEFSVRGYDETGPWVIIGGGHNEKPDEKDVKKAVRFVQKVLPNHYMPDYYQHVQNKLPIRNGEPNSYFIGTNGESVLLKGDRVTFNHNNCNGCGKCAEVCPLNIIQFENKKALSNRELDCTLCRLCVDNCKQRAIYLHYNWHYA